MATCSLFFVQIASLLASDSIFSPCYHSLSVIQQFVFHIYLQTGKQSYLQAMFSYAQNNQGFTLTYIHKDIHLIHWTTSVDIGENLSTFLNPALSQETQKKASSRRTRRAPQSYNLSSSSDPPLQNRRRPGPKGRNSIALRGML